MCGFAKKVVRESGTSVQRSGTTAYWQQRYELCVEKKNLQELIETRLACIIWKRINNTALCLLKIMLKRLNPTNRLEEDRIKIKIDDLLNWVHIEQGKATMNQDFRQR